MPSSSGRVRTSRHENGPLADIVDFHLNALFVGINPGFASAKAGHHFANPANGFWRLMHEAGFTPRRFAPHEGELLLRQGLGMTNLVARETAGVADLTPRDFEQGRRVLSEKVERYRPEAVVFVGITAFRAFRGIRGPVQCGEQPERVGGARIFVVPNPSGRNAHFRHRDMLDAFLGVAQALGFAPEEGRVESRADGERKGRKATTRR